MDQVSKATCTVGGQERTLAFDLNCVEALEKAKGPDWNRWLGDRFVGSRRPGGKGTERDFTPFTTGDVVLVLFALLSTDREEKGLEETEATLRRSTSMLEIPDLRNAVVKVVFKSFGISDATIALAMSPQALTEPAGKAKRQPTKRKGK